MRSEYTANVALRDAYDKRQTQRDSPPWMQPAPQRRSKAREESSLRALFKARGK